MGQSLLMKNRAIAFGQEGKNRALSAVVTTFTFISNTEIMPIQRVAAFRCFSVVIAHPKNPFPLPWGEGKRGKEKE